MLEDFKPGGNMIYFYCLEDNSNQNLWRRQIEVVAEEQARTESRLALEVVMKMERNR